MMRAAVGPFLGLLGVFAAADTAAIAQESGPAKSAGAATLKTFVSIAPQAFFLERIGGQWVEVNVLVAPNQSYHVFEPTPKQMAALGDAKLYFKLGLQFEETLLPKIAASHAHLTIVDTARNVPLRDMAESHADHQHGGAKDPHIWLSPKLAKIQARNICDALRQADAPHAGDFENNYAALCADLDALDAKLRELLAPYRGRAIFVFHPSYGYFAADYGLKQVAVEMEGKEPAPRQLAELIDTAKAADAKVIFVQPQFSRKSAEAIAQSLGGEVVEMDPLARDYLKNMQTMAEKVRAALARTSGGAR